jgi:deoxycytidylate deaminase
MKAAEKQGDTLLVVRIISGDKFVCSKPCKNCLRFAKEYGIKKIYYIDWDSKLKKMKV